MKQLNWYQIFGNAHIIPDGRTVTPTDDIQTLLHCANIWDKSYTTIGEVIADDDTLFLTLIDNNAIDYLVRSTTFASSIVASESAVQYIGASDYASDTLLNDSTWNVAVADSIYYEYVLDLKNPKMTGYTTPKGEVFQSSVNGPRYGWYAFDDTLTNFWASTTPTNSYIGYRFTQPFRLRTVRIAGGQPDVPTQSPKNIIVQCSSDGITYNDVQSIVASQYADEKFAIINNSEVSYWKMFCTDNYGAPTATAIREINFYGREIGGVQSWLKAGGVEGKKYTTVSEVLSDLTTLATLMSSTDAIDYLVTAKGWATEICSDSNAMADIGMNNYASNTLLDDATWCNAICNSTYFESVLNVKVPKMTSATTPEGTVISSGSDFRAAYTAFDGKLDNSTFWMSKSGMPVYIGYRFVRPIFVSKVEVVTLSDTPGPRTSMLQGSTDGVNWDDLGAFVNCPSTNSKYSLGYYNTSDYYDYYRLYITASNRSGGDIAVIKELQFYGRKDI